jgi:hypothetical protein
LNSRTKIGEVKQREEIEGVRELEKNKFSVHTMNVKMDRTNDTKKILIGEKGRIQGQVK